ncbi:hypothetical protein EJ05DRAFT_500813 [Pseudovirgaria hyperparasitica]|uniref:Uncharacterized protein n=1 Tax=Pseudovirgaria hyperparasitica TaxID=470096 RepID=A0A6A6W5Q3_9PEZI|nr:uncharacterized protein EJ05DRAFT_500813 [Pseudovirgaria hyperparasitica]KAF2757270.1 hypothetical protein EJ05DRAFT_500813 [Pseudovirgaria hyperparasitica]
MTYSPVWLCKYRRSSNMRYHFALFIPNKAYVSQNPQDKNEVCKGTIIHVVGAPMAGYSHEFKRNYDTSTSDQLRGLVHIGHVDQGLVYEPPTEDFSRHSSAMSSLERVALQIQAPRASENFMAPVNDTTNRRCQEWTVDYIRALVRHGYLHENATAIAQAERDPPEFGIGLQSIGQVGARSQGGRAQASSAHATSQAQVKQGQAGQAVENSVSGWTPWEWYADHSMWGRYSATKGWDWRDAEKPQQGADASKSKSAAQAGQASGASASGASASDASDASGEDWSAWQWYADSSKWGRHSETHGWDWRDPT